MFDKLVESTNQKHGRRAGSYFAATTLIYGLALIGITIGTIIGFSPVLAEEYALKALMTPPLPPVGSPPAPVVQPRPKETAVDNTFSPPTIPPRIPPASEADRHPLADSRPVVPGAPPGSSNANSYLLFGRDNGGSAPPPPPPRPTPKIEPTPTPEIKPQGPNRVSEGVLQGIAVRKEKPIYPAMAKTIRASGPVQVQVTISEEGRVIEATALNGHPMLRTAAVEAARKWLFSPTYLSKVPVKVQGVLTFNFVLEQ